MYYMSILMNQVGFDDTNSTYMSMVGGGALFLGTIPAIFLMERCGRRFWAITMLPGFFIGLVITGCSYLVDVKTNPAKTEGLYLTGLILYMGFYGPYACLTWVIPSEIYPTYLRSYGMTVSDAMVFLGSFIITYNFTAMQQAMTKTGLTLGFFGGIAVLGWFYQIFFMPETKDMTLEEVDMVFSKPTRQLVAENIASTKKTVSNLVRFRFREAYPGFAASKRS
jgi:MFS family permease